MVKQLKVKLQLQGHLRDVGLKLIDGSLLLSSFPTKKRHLYNTATVRLLREDFKALDDLLTGVLHRHRHSEAVDLQELEVVFAAILLAQLADAYELDSSVGELKTEKCLLVIKS